MDSGPQGPAVGATLGAGVVALEVTSAAGMSAAGGATTTTYAAAGTSPLPQMEEATTSPGDDDTLEVVLGHPVYGHLRMSPSLRRWTRPVLHYTRCGM
jgi:hypothetical protein